MSKKSIEYANTYEVLKPHGFTHADLDTLHRAESTLNRLNEEECNGWPVMHNDGRVYYDWDQKRADANKVKSDRIEARVTRLVESHGLTVSFGGDPRGCAIRILLPADENGRRRYNSWDGESWVIDW
jgi:hypothetical protein